MASRSEQKEGTISLHKENARLKKQVAALQKEVKELRGFSASASNTNHSACSNQTQQFWRNIEEKLLCDPDSVKLLLKKGELNMEDVNERGQDLITQAARWGTYDIVQLCLNLKTTDYKKVIEGTHNFVSEFPHIKQLLLFDSLNANVGDTIHVTADTINRQQGIIQNIIEQLKWKKNKKIVKDTLIDIMVNIIQQKKSFSDDLLNLCFELILNENNDPLKSNLWNQIAKTCSDVIQHGNKRDWFWLKEFVIPSTIWFRDLNKMKQKNSDEKEKENDENVQPSYMYYKLLDLVTNEAQHQLSELSENLNGSTPGFDELITFDYVDEYYDASNMRQDSIPNGIKAQYSYSELSSASSAKFKAAEFYDLNKYLPDVLLLAQTVDDDFQRSVQNIFKIDTYSKIGELSGGSVRYMRGPVKLLKRAKSKAENDYFEEAYPTSACILDLNRCTFVFDDISSLMVGLNTFVNKVKYYQSGNIIGVVRTKNLFKEYAKEVQYADIKLNVIIKGKTNNIIGEVQFLLKAMKLYKAKAHNLYSIQRQEEFVENSVSKILPSLLDSSYQLWVAALLGDVKGLCKLMVFNNKDIDYILNTRNVTQECVLHGICKKNHVKALLFVREIVNNDTLLAEKLFLRNENSMNPIHYAAEYGGSAILKTILEIERVQQVFQTNPDQLFSFICTCFPNGCPNNKGFVKQMLSLCDLSETKLVEMLQHEVQMPSDYKSRKGVRENRWWFSSLIGYSAGWALRMHGLTQLVHLIGAKLFTQYVFYQDALGLSPLIRAIRFNLDAAKYMFSFDEIVQKCATDKDILFQIVISLTFKYYKPDEETIKYVINVLNLEETTLRQLQSFKCRKGWDGKRGKYFDAASWSARWWEHNISDDDVNTLLNLRKS